MQDNSITGSDDRATLIAYPQTLILPDINQKQASNSNNFEQELQMIAQESPNKIESQTDVPSPKMIESQTDVPNGHIAIATLPSKGLSGMGAKIMPKVAQQAVIYVPKKERFKTVSDTIQVRNKRLEKYTPEQYNQIYLLKNLKNIERIGGKPTPEAILSTLVENQSNKDLNYDNYWIESSCRPHICNGKVFSIATNRINNKRLDQNFKVQPKIQKTSIAVYLHGEFENGSSQRKVFEKELWNNDQPHNWHSVARPCIINGNNMYIATFKNNWVKNTIKHEIFCFNFDDCKAPEAPVYEQEEKMMKDSHIGKYHYACQTMLSFYIHYDSRTGTMNPNHPLSQMEFLQKTFLSVRYRTHKEKPEPNEDEGYHDKIKEKESQKKSNDDDQGTDSEIDEKDENKYYSSIKVFHLKEFAEHKTAENWAEGVRQDECFVAHKEESFKGSPNYKDSDIFPQIQFVLNNQFYILKRSKKIQIGSMEIEKVEEADKELLGEKNLDKVKLGPYQDVNQLKKDTRDHFMSFYLRPFSIFNVNAGSNEIEGEHLIPHQCWELPGQRKKRKGADKNGKVKEDMEALIVPDYHEIAEHFKFINQDEKKSTHFSKTKDPETKIFNVNLSDKIDAMSIIFNMTGKQPQVTMIVASDNFLHSKIINIRHNFTRMYRQVGDNPRKNLWSNVIEKISTKGIDYGKTIKQNDYVTKTHIGKEDETMKQGEIQIKLKGSEGHSIYLEISYNRLVPIKKTQNESDKIETPKSESASSHGSMSAKQLKKQKTLEEDANYKKENEILLIEELQLKFDVKQFGTACLSWCTNLHQDQGSTEWERNLLCGLLDKSGQVAQIIEYKIGYHSEQLKDRCVDRKEAMTSMQYLNFLRKTPNIISFEIVGLNQIIFKEPYDQPLLLLCPTMKKIEGKEDEVEDDIEFAQLLYKNFSIKFYERGNSVFQIQSDIAQTMYKYYFDGDAEEPSVIHIQCLLSDLLEATSKSPDVDAISVLNSIKQTNSRLSDQMNSTAFGIPSSFFLYLQQKWTKKEGLNQIDRFVLLKSACKSLMNMVPVNFQDFTIQKERLDLLQPVEQLDCQNECDFFLDQPSYLKSDLNNEKLEGNDKTGQLPLFPGIIQKFVMQMQPEYRQGVTDSLKDKFYWRTHHQIINALFFSNSLMRCFTQKKVRIQAAKILIDHLMSNPITQTERDIIMSTLPNILKCEYEPFSFQRLSKFFSRPPMNQPGAVNTHQIGFSQNIPPREEILFNDSPQEITMIDQRNYAISSPEFKVFMGTYQLIQDNEQTNIEDLTIPVDHYIIDFHSIYLFQKLTYIRKNNGLKMASYKPQTIQEIISDINDSFGYDIENHIALQRIIDAHFAYTKGYFTWLFGIYMFGFVFSFIAQMQIQDSPQVVHVLTNICLGVTILFQFLSLIEFKNTKNKLDFFDFFNIINNTSYIVYYYYYHSRQRGLDFKYLPNDLKEYEIRFPFEQQAITSICTVVILTGILIKSMELVRFDINMGKLVKLVFAVLYDVRFLFLFLILNICVFALYYLALGYKLTSEDLGNQQFFWDYFIESWKLATKGSRTTIETIWGGSAGDKYLPIQNFIMVLTIFNEIYLKIIMLSFLIAIVKKTFDTQMKIEMQNKYSMRCEMNKESSTAFNQIGLLDFQDMFVLSAQFESPPLPDKMEKFQKEMRGEMSQMKKMITMLAEKQGISLKPQEEEEQQ